MVVDSGGLSVLFLQATNFVRPAGALGWRKGTRPMADAPSPSDVALLAGFFHRNGYTRWQDTGRQQREGYWAYKKGDEVRLVAESLQELELIRRLLRRAGFRPGRPFRKGRQFRQPVYGREAVARFLALIDEVGRV